MRGEPMLVSNYLSKRRRSSGPVGGGRISNEPCKRVHFTPPFELAGIHLTCRNNLRREPQFRLARKRKPSGSSGGVNTVRACKLLLTIQCAHDKSYFTSEGGRRYGHMKKRGPVSELRVCERGGLHV